MNAIKELLFHLTASAAAANTNGDPSANAGDNDTCLQLALEGEKLCKGGNCRDGVAFFEAALQAGTDDFRTLSAIYRYSQETIIFGMVGVVLRLGKECMVNRLVN